MRKRLMERIKDISLGYAIILVASATVVAVIVVGTKSGVVSLLASSASTLNGHPAVIYFAPQGEETLALGQTARVDVKVNSRIPINAVGATISVPMESLEVLGVSKEGSFLDLWTEDTTIKESTGEVHFSGGTIARGGATGIRTVLSLTVRAKKIGRAELSFKDAQIFAHDGRGRALESDMRSFAFTIPDNAVAPSGASVETPKPDPDLNNDGGVSLADISIFAIQLLSPYNARYDLDMDGAVALSDLSILFSRMR